MGYGVPYTTAQACSTARHDWCNHATALGSVRHDWCNQAMGLESIFVLSCQEPILQMFELRDKDKVFEVGLEETRKRSSTKRISSGKDKRIASQKNQDKWFSQFYYHHKETLHTQATRRVSWETNDIMQIYLLWSNWVGLYRALRSSLSEAKILMVNGTTHVVMFQYLSTDKQHDMFVLYSTVQSCNKSWIPTSLSRQEPTWQMYEFMDLRQSIWGGIGGKWKRSSTKGISTGE
jgi:hypothetical protein